MARARNLSEVFTNKNLTESAWRFAASGGAFGIVEAVSAKTSGSFREMFILGVIFGIPTLINFLSYAYYDSQEYRGRQSQRNWWEKIEDNIFESPRR